jgi:hypothetical protein
MLSLALTMRSKTSAMSGDGLKLIRSWAVSFSWRTCDGQGRASMARGDDGVTGAVGSRASTMGEDSSTRRPTLETMRSMIFFKWELSLKREPVSTSIPDRST